MSIVLGARGLRKRHGDIEGGRGIGFTIDEGGGFLALVLGIVFFQINPGLLALSISLVLLLASDRGLRDAAVNQVSWPIVLVIGGVLTYVNLLISAGATDWLAAQETDGRFVTRYAERKPKGEDLAESALFAYTILHHPDRIPRGRRRCDQHGCEQPVCGEATVVDPVGSGVDHHPDDQ